MDYLQYCKLVLLTEENQKEVFERLHKAFPENAEYIVYSSILNSFPSLNAKSIITSVLIRTKNERKKTNVTPEATKHIFDQLIELLKRNTKVDLAAMLKKDRTDHPVDEDSQLFTHFTELVHQHISKIAAIDARKLQKKSAIHIAKSDEDEEETIPTKYPNPLYTDDDIEVYQAKSPGQCASYQGNSGICLKYAANFYGTYRIPHESAFYYVFPKTPKESFTGGPIGFDPNVGRRGVGGHHRFLLVEVRKDETGVWSWEDNVMNRFQKLDDLKSIFPFLVRAIDDNVFKKYPLSDEERESHELVENTVNDITFIQFPPTVKDMYIANRHNLTDKMWSVLTRVQKNDYINLSQERDLTDGQYEDVKRDPQLYKRYIAIKKRSIGDKIKSGTFTQIGFGKHEAAILPNLMSGMSDDEKKKLSTDLVKVMKDILTGAKRPQVDISGIYNLFKGQLLADPIMQRDELLVDIASILAGGKTKAWKELAPNIKTSVYGVAQDLYNANPRKMKELIDNQISKDPDTLLQGLIDVPTDFQVQYFKTHESELLTDGKFGGGFFHALKSHLVYGTDLPTWLKDYWNTNKNKYINDPGFMESLKTDFQNMLYGKKSAEYPSYKDFPEETKELYDKIIDEIRQDPNSLPIVQQTLYDFAVTAGENLDNIDNWKVSDEYKKYFKDHENELKSWLTYKMIDTPVDDQSPELVKIVEKYKNSVLSDPHYRKLIENRLVSDIINNEAIISTSWSSSRIGHWLQHFYEILARYPGSEKSLVEKMKKEYGSDRTANSFYSEFGIPFEFYKKHEKEILSDPEAYRGLKEKVLEALRWRANENITDEEAVQQRLSAIERDFYENHKNDLETRSDEENAQWKGKPIFTPARISIKMRGH